jgi:hypothetical protein
MKMLSVTVLLGAIALGTYVSAQDTPVVTSRPRYTAADMRKQVSGEFPRTCSLPDKTTHLVTTVVTFAGKMYRCVEVFDENLRVSGAAWTLAQ